MTSKTTNIITVVAIFAIMTLPTATLFAGDEPMSPEEIVMIQAHVEELVLVQVMAQLCA